MRLSREVLHARLEQMPMVKAAVPVILGVVCMEYWQLPIWFTVTSMVICAGLALVCRSGLYTLAALLCCGMSAAEMHRPHTTIPHNQKLLIACTVDDTPARRGAYTTTTAHITAWRTDQSPWKAAREKIVLRTDTARIVRAGEQLLCRGYLRDFSDRHPSYRQLMLHRGYTGTLYLRGKQYLESTPAHSNTLHHAAVARLEALHLSPPSQALCSAMATGERSGLGQELRKAYSRSGTAHLLAVSGLHVGIVFLLVNTLLWWMPALRYGHILRNLMAVLLMWLYAALTGLPPSVVRAAVMFSALQFALATTSARVPMNILAATAVGMLLLDTNYLFDISFQLSFIAVIAILTWGMPLYDQLRGGHKWLNLLTASLLIGALSTLATAPLVSHTFGVVSLVGIVLNPVAILLAEIIVLGSVVWIILPIDLFASPFRLLLDTAATTLNALTDRAAALPAGAIDYTLSTTSTLIIYAFFIIATLFLWSIEPRKKVSLSR